MPGATIIIDLNHPEDDDLVNAWFERWGSEVTCSENQGCGCCVNIYSVQAPAQALAELPEQLFAS